MSKTRMSHVTHKNVSRHTGGGHVTHKNESCHAQGLRVTSHSEMSQITHKNESHPTQEGVMSYTVLFADEFVVDIFAIVCKV